MRKLIRAFVSKFRPILPAVEHRLHNLSIFRQLVIREFHKLYYEQARRAAHGSIHTGWASRR
jgi:hypothetical protein